MLPSENHTWQAGKNKLAKLRLIVAGEIIELNCVFSLAMFDYHRICVCVHLYADVYIHMKFHDTKYIYIYIYIYYVYIYNHICIYYTQGCIVPWHFFWEISPCKAPWIGCTTAEPSQNQLLC